MSKTIAKGLFYGVAAVLLLWTASLTYRFVATVLPNAHWLVPAFALAVFDAGMIAWLKVYIDHAQGNGQRATALSTCVFDFIGVGLMVLVSDKRASQSGRLSEQLADGMMSQLVAELAADADRDAVYRTCFRMATAVSGRKHQLQRTANTTARRLRKRQKNCSSFSNEI